MIYHWAVGADLSMLPNPVASVFLVGYAGVPFFFVLSGFILAYNYLGTDEPLDRGRFYAARLARVYPVYAFALLVSLPLLIRSVRSADLGWRTTGLVVGTVPTLLQSWVPSSAVTCQWDCPSWTLSNEAFFYLLFPAIAVLLPTRTTRTFVVASCVWLISLVGPLVLSVAHGGLAGATDAQTADVASQFVLFNPVVRLPEFIVGMAAGVWFANGGRVARPSLCAWLATATILVVYAASGWLPTPLLHNSLIAPLYALLVVALASGRQTGFLATRGMVLLGEASYAIYLLHVPVMSYLQHIAEHEGVGKHSWVMLPATFVVTAALSIATLLLVERPARSWLHARLSSRPRRTPLRATPHRSN